MKTLKWLTLSTLLLSPFTLAQSAAELDEFFADINGEFSIDRIECRKEGSKQTVSNPPESFSIEKVSGGTWQITIHNGWWDTKKVRLEEEQIKDFELSLGKRTKALSLDFNSGYDYIVIDTPRELIVAHKIWRVPGRGSRKVLFECIFAHQY